MAEADDGGPGSEHAFLLAVAHDLRSTVSALSGLIDVLRSTAGRLTSAEFEALTARMADAAAEAEGVIANLLDVERLRYGVAHLARSPTSLADLVRRAVGRVGREGIETDVGDATVDLDAGLTERVLVNLIGNAVAHTPTGTRIAVQARDEGDHVLLRVDDTGPGIPEDIRPHVFEPFHRSSGPGIGLGLYVVGELARLHGGDVTIEDGPAGGTSVCVRLATR